MMKRVVTLAVVLVLAGGLAALPAQARFGAQVSYGDNTQLGIGARLQYPLTSLFKNAPVTSAASFDWFFPDEPAGVNVTAFEINYNIFYQFKVDALTPYAGGGLVLGYASSDPGGSNTDLGLNLGGGLQFKTGGRLAPFIEGRFELSAFEQFVITGGLVF